MAKNYAVDEFVSAVKSALPFIPNADQVIAIKRISDFVYSSDERSVFVLKGYAGTGKTNLISAFVKALPNIKWRSELLAPTGRAAKVISNYSKKEAFTIHKKIFRKSVGDQGEVLFSLAENLHKNTLFVVDEASMISADNPGEHGYFNTLLESLFEYVYSGENCKLIIVGDTAQLPPVNSPESPALDINYLKGAFHLNISWTELKEVARQQHESGILINATELRILLQEKEFIFPKLTCYKDVVNVNGEDLEDTINSAISKYGEEDVIIITRSNKRANLFNQNFRNRIKLYEENICTGDKLMIVKNNYYWLPEKSTDTGFIANGDIAEVTRITRRENLYGFNFIDCSLRFIDYPDLPEQEVKLLIDSLYTDSPSLSIEEQKKLYNEVLQDVADEPSRAIRANYLRKSPYYNALQVKFSYAITCHKSQGGQWPVVFIDLGYIKEENVDKSFIRWLYTAITRASEKVYLIGFNDLFIK